MVGEGVPRLSSWVSLGRSGTMRSVARQADSQGWRLWMPFCMVSRRCAREDDGEETERLMLRGKVVLTLHLDPSFSSTYFIQPSKVRAQTSKPLIVHRNSARATFTPDVFIRHRTPGTGEKKVLSAPAQNRDLTPTKRLAWLV